VNESRKGLLWARERGRQEALGEIIVNIDADCLPESDWLSRGISHFMNEKIVAVSGPYDYHDASPLFRHSSLLTQKYIYKIASEIVQLPFIKKGAMLIGGNNLIRASVLHKAGGYNTDLTFYGEDTDTAKRVSLHGRVLFVPELIMKTSARRFKKEGIINIEAKYIYNFFKHTFKRTDHK
jgi:GT2 family glycosyltransferase